MKISSYDVAKMAIDSYLEEHEGAEMPSNSYSRLKEVCGYIDSIMESNDAHDVFCEIDDDTKDVFVGFSCVVLSDYDNKDKFSSIVSNSVYIDVDTDVDGNVEIMFELNDIIRIVNE